MSAGGEGRPEASSNEDLPLLDPTGHGAYYRELADNLRSLDGPPGSVVVTGVGEGAGCSSVCVGLGGALASMGLRVAVVDCNFARPRLHKVLGEPNFTGLATALEIGSHPEDCGYEPAPGLLVVPTGPIPENPAQSLQEGDLAGLVGGLREERDVVVLDAPRSPEVQASPLLSTGFDGVLLVVNASRTARREAREATDGLAGAGANLLGVVLNGRA